MTVAIIEKAIVTREKEGGREREKRDRAIDTHKAATMLGPVGFILMTQFSVVPRPAIIAIIR